MFKEMMKRMKKNEKGFTLVELMVVVVIIGVLVAIAVPVYNNSTKKAEENACKANQRIINSAITQYKMNSADGKTLPTALTDLTGYFEGGIVPKCPSDSTKDYDYDDEKGIVSCDGENHALYPKSATPTTAP